MTKCYFGRFKKRIVRQNDYKMNNFWKKSPQQTKSTSLISMLKELARVNDVNT